MLIPCINEESVVTGRIGSSGDFRAPPLPPSHCFHDRTAFGGSPTLGCNDRSCPRSALPTKPDPVMATGTRQLPLARVMRTFAIHPWQGAPRSAPELFGDRFLNAPVPTSFDENTALADD